MAANLTPPENRWPTPEHAGAYLAHAHEIPHRGEGEAVLVELLPARVSRVLDLGCGDGRTLALVRDARPGAAGVALDFSPPMLERARDRFAGDADVEVVVHDLAEALPDLGRFDVVVSSFAIHHLDDARKAQLYAEVAGCLAPGGWFANLEHVSSPTTALHQAFLAELAVAPDDEDPANQLAPVGVQLDWLRAVGFVDVDCFWKWRELALLAGSIR
jgi:tRNA (cmo5U34)-methyltransferase